MYFWYMMGRADVAVVKKENTKKDHVKARLKVSQADILYRSMSGTLGMAE